MDQEKEEEIKVTDRRKFHPDGSRKSSSPEEDRVEAEFPSPSFTGSSTVGSSGEREKPEALMFLDFLAGLVGGAASQLGMVPHPGSGKAEVDLVGAKQLIDILSVLQEKTKGNLNPQEHQFLENALTELRLAYVRASSQHK